MFKKLKDKLTEEVKIPSQKFTQSMQQLAQAVVSPASSNNSAYDAASNDNFSIDGDFDDTPQNSPNKKVEGGVAYRGGQATPIRNSFDTGTGAGFSHVDLQQDASTPKVPASLRSSFSSLASDSSFMFPVLESSGPTYNFQSDLESCSEASESVGPNVNKEQLLVAYRKIQQKYHKYKGRYSDLARHYRDLERDNKNAKHILTECQDKALRRMTELKEQCNLEKQAKAHLEEALRSDLEEKDHLIDTLKTKIKLLKSQVDLTQTSGLEIEKPATAETSEILDSKPSKLEDQEDLLTGNDTSPGKATALLLPEPVNLDSENTLREKVKKLESLLHKCKEDITSKRDNIKQLESDKVDANTKIEILQQQLIAIQKREEEASLSLAKNKQTIHLELESKEEEIKKLKMQLSSANAKVSELNAEVSQIKEDIQKEVAVAKAEVTNAMTTEREELLAEKRSIESLLSVRESECKAHEERTSDLLNRLELLEAELTPLKTTKDDLERKFTEESKLLKEEISDLQNQLKTVASKKDHINKFNPILKSVQELRGLYSELKIDASKNLSSSMSLLCQETEHMKENIQRIILDLTEERAGILSELNEHKAESANTKELLSNVSDQLASLVAEKSGLESKMCDLQNSLKEAVMKVSNLELNLESERSLRQSVEEEAAKKLALLQDELDEEKSNSQKVIEESTSADTDLQGKIDEMDSLMKRKEEKILNLAQENKIMKEKSNTLQMTSEQLQQELEILKTRDRESMNEMTSMNMLLNEKNSYVEELEVTVSDLQSNLDSVLTEKKDLKLELQSKEAELVSQITDLKTKNKEVCDVLKDLQTKDATRSSENDSLNYENKEKQKQIYNLEIIIQDHKVNAEKFNVENNELQEKVGDLLKQCQKKDSAIADLKEDNEALQVTTHLLESNSKAMLEQIENLQKANNDLQENLTHKVEQLNVSSKIQEALQTKIEEFNTLRFKLEQATHSYQELENKLQSKVNECMSQNDEIQSIISRKYELEKDLQEKHEECKNLTKELESLKSNKAEHSEILEEKVKQIESYQTLLSSSEAQQSENSGELVAIKERCEKLAEEVESFRNAKADLTKNLEIQREEIQTLSNHLELTKKELAVQTKLLNEKTIECNDLVSKVDILTSDNEKIAQILKQRTFECEEKEAQLDSLADEMKRVEELSQELHRINDDRDANVEVLSTEASSLAEKVEELTITTQELKEREVDLLSKLKVAQGLEAEYVSMKQREEQLLSKLSEAKFFETDLKANEEELLAKTQKIKELEEENEKLREAGLNLNDVIYSAKEAEAKCEKLQNDGATLLLRIQKAEESELKCSRLEDELETMKNDKLKLLQEIEMLQTKSVTIKTAGDENNSSSPKEPVVEEPCIVKRYADLTENSYNAEDGEWREKYDQLLEQHQIALQENSATISRLKEENLMLVEGRNVRQKERLWDRDELVSTAIGSSTNGSLGTVEKLQQQLATLSNQLKDSKRLHRQEVDDLRRILLNHGSGNSHAVSRSDNLEDATELEYLRNILFEYMMGKEPMILARVIAAVVKFDADQTSKVLQKEQQRLSLLGHLGIS